MTEKSTGTEFTSSTTNHGPDPNGGVPKLMSAYGDKCSKKTAPANAMQATFASSAVDELMRGKQ